VPVAARSFVGVAILVIQYVLTKGSAMNGVVPYGVTCARRARVMSVDLEGHAPSWPCATASGRAAARPSIWLRPQAALANARFKVPWQVRVAFTICGILLLVGAQLMASDIRIREPDGHFDRPEGCYFGRVLFTPDGKQLVATGVDRRARESRLGIIGFWDVSTRKLVCTRTLPAVVGARVCTADGKRLVASCWDNKVYVFVAPKWEIERVFDYDPPNQTAMDLAILADGKRLLSPNAGDRGLRIWDLTNWKSTSLAKGGELVQDLAVSKDGKRFAVAYLGPIAEIWDAEKLQVIGQLQLKTDQRLQGVFLSVAFSPDGKTIAAGYGHERTHPVAIWDAATLQRLHTCRGFAEFAEPAEALAYSPDGKLLAACSGPDFDKPAHIIIWEVASGKLVYQFYSAKQGGGMNMALSPDGRWLVHCSADDSTLRLWDFEKIRREIGK
jgi:WD40 repeat protein